jgi:hypothetical protein
MAQHFDDWQHYNTNVPWGEAPTLVNSKGMSGQAVTTGSALSGKSVTSIKKLGGGCKESWKVQFEDGTYAVYKPKAGERQGLRRGITHEYTREAIAYEIEKYLKFGQVPETLVLDIPVPTLPEPVYIGGRYRQPSKGVGAYQLWKKGKMGAELTPQEYAQIPLKEKQKLVLLDLIAQQTDRHSQNWLFNTTTKQVVAIDNGLCLPKSGKSFRLSFGSAVAGTSIPAEMKQALKKFYDSKPAFKVAVRQALGGVLPTEESTAINKMFDRIKKLLDTGKFPSDLGSYDGSNVSIWTDQWD